MTPKAKVGAETAASLTLAPLDLKTMQLHLIGDSPLICHAWSEKARAEMLNKQMKKARGAREAKNPTEQFAQSLYWLSDRPAEPTTADIEQGRFGFPSIAFKSAAVTAVTSVEGLTKVAARQSFHVTGETADFVRIHGVPTMREDMVRVGMAKADIRFRGEFREWSADVQIRFNKNVLSPEQIASLFNLAGFAVGIGEWRPERDGGFGLFHVETTTT